jgi:hypothetical protein
VEVNLRSSQGTTHALTLPEGAELVELRTGDVVQPLRQEGRRVPIAVNPGANYAFVKFRVPVGLSTALRVPAIDLGAPAVNVETRVQGLGDRWLVYLKGPRLGPAILYWSLLVVLAVLGGILSRAKTLPLGALGWFALTIGLSQVGWASGAVVVGWFVVMDLRGRFGHEGGSPLGFNARQGALVLWTYWALSTLLDAVKAGLLGKPDMQLAGNGSTVETLTWFQDRVAAVPESPLVISCPMLVYRGLMLLWALWLAWALLHWVRWAWTCFSQGGLWRPLRKPRGMPSRDEIEPTETPTPEPQG